MNIEKHINNLKEYIETDFAFKEPEKNESDFDEFCYNHCKDIDAVINELDKAEADLYEANNRINDLLDIVKQKDEIINEMVDKIYKVDWQSECGNSREDIKKYFEERCK